MNEPVIKIRVREAYGVRRAYPECDKARIFANMLGAKTLTDAALISIKALGFKIVEVR